MNYVVVDLGGIGRWAPSHSVFNKLPIHLRSEIIQISAVRLNEDMTPGEGFQIDVKPVYFKGCTTKVKEAHGLR